ncbi:hypothetical protein [Anderseniella sp. Alg231-50]|uniref:hypothetical protein n=1 Tax=Anderseniella sp. Alg231-50 TaxID=1922226 RepID=UPI000D55BD50
MSGDLNQRPFLLLILKVMRAMLWFCIAGLVLVGGGIWYSVTKVQARTYEHFTSADIWLFSFIAGLVLIAVLLLVGIHRMLRKHT